MNRVKEGCRLVSLFVCEDTEATLAWLFLFMLYCLGDLSEVLSGLWEGGGNADEKEVWHSVAQFSVTSFRIAQ
jgi:hypothetical protein